MKRVKLAIIGGVLILFLPILTKAQLVWYDNFEQDSVGGPAQGWGWIAAYDSTWKVVMDGSTKVYRHWSGDSSLWGEIFAKGYDPPPVAFTAQMKVKVTDFFFSSNPYFHLPKLGFRYGGNVYCYFSPTGFYPDVDGNGLFLTDIFMNCLYFAYLPYDLEINRWYYFKMGQSDTVNQHPPQIYFKVWPGGEEEPEGWMIHPGLGGYYIPPDLFYSNRCNYLPESVCPHYLGLVANATYANFDEIEVFSGLEGVEDYEGQIVVPRAFKLHQNYPNPFNATTAIPYNLSAVSGQRSAVSLKIYNTLGQEIRTLVDGAQGPGDYEVFWDGKNNQGKEVSSGVYLCRLRCGGLGQIRKLVLLR